MTDDFFENDPSVVMLNQFVNKPDKVISAEISMKCGATPTLRTSEGTGTGLPSGQELVFYRTYEINCVDGQLFLEKVKEHNNAPLTQEYVDYLLSVIEKNNKEVLADFLKDNGLTLLGDDCQSE